MYVSRLRFQPCNLRCPQTTVCESSHIKYDFYISLIGTLAYIACWTSYCGGATVRLCLIFTIPQTMAATTAIPPSAAPTPIPAFAPVLRSEDGVEVGDEVAVVGTKLLVVVLLDLVFVWVDVVIVAGNNRVCTEGPEAYFAGPASKTLLAFVQQLLSKLT